MLTNQELSNMGFKSVRSGIIKPVLENTYFINPSGLIYSKLINDFIKNEFDKDGYPRVTLRDSNNVNKHYFTHILVAYTFLGDPPKNIKNPQVDHINRNRCISHVSNLRWVSNIDNLRNRHFENKRLSIDKVHEICEDLESHNYQSLYELSKKYNIARPIISNIKCGKTYKNVSKNYNLTHRENNEKLSDEIVHKICKDLIYMRSQRNGEQTNFTLQDIANKYNVCISTIKHIVQHKSYCEISDMYNFGKSVNDFRLERRKQLLLSYKFGIQPKVFINDVKSIYNIYGTFYKHGVNVEYTLTEPLTHFYNETVSKPINTIVTKNTFNITKHTKIYKNEITDDDVHEICKILEKFPSISISAISDQTNVNPNIINNIKSGRTHKNISKFYNILPTASCERSVPDETIINIAKSIEMSRKNTYYKSPTKTLTQIAKDFDINESYVKQIASRAIAADLTKKFDFGYNSHERQQHKNEICEVLYNFNFSKQETYDFVGKLFEISKRCINDIYKKISDTKPKFNTFSKEITIFDDNKNSFLKNFTDFV